MIYKYYTCDFVTLTDDELQVPSMIVKVYRWWTPIMAHTSIKNQLTLDGYGPHHRIINFKRVR
jgi:hypothetical protein